jgi:signal transduction histidine kinase
MNSSLQTRLLLFVGGLAVMAVVAVALAARQGTRQDFNRFQEFEERAQGPDAPHRAEALASGMQGRCCEPPALDTAARGLGPDAVLLVTDVAKGALIASAGRPLQPADRVTTSRKGDVLAVEATLRRRTTMERVALRFRQPGLSLRLRDGRDALFYMVSFPNPERRRHTEAFLIAVDRRLQFTTAFVGMFALALTWTIVRSSVRPLEELRAATRDLARGRLGTRVRPRGSREVVELGRDFNAMADDLERQHVLRQRLLHDVAHELRTPLTALQCRLETVIDGLARDPSQAVRDLHDDVRHLGSLVDDLQDVALAEAGELRLAIADHAASDIVRSALRAAGLDGDGRVRLDVPETLTLRADERRLRQVMVNLLSNANRHTPQDGVIEIAGLLDGEEVRLSVRNTGSSLTPEACDRAFDRFYRTDPARQRTTGGTGLGLAIVKHLVEAHGGRVWAESDADEVTVRISLPSSASGLR